MIRLIYKTDTGEITQFITDATNPPLYVEPGTGYIDVDNIDLNTLSGYKIAAGELVKREDYDQVMADIEWTEIRMMRDRYLASSDWTENSSVQALHTDEWKTAWAAYRQALRDVTDQADPFNIVWPTPPEIAN